MKSIFATLTILALASRSAATRRFRLHRPATTST